MVILLVSRINGSVTNEETNKSVCELDSQKVQVSLNRAKGTENVCGAFKRSRATCSLIHHWTIPTQRISHTFFVSCTNKYISSREQSRRALQKKVANQIQPKKKTRAMHSKKHTQKKQQCTLPHTHSHFDVTFSNTVALTLQQKLISLSL